MQQQSNIEDEETLSEGEEDLEEGEIRDKDQ